MKIEKILVPVDFSERSAAAARHAVALAHRFGSRLIFAHAIPPAPAEYAGFEGGYYTARMQPASDDTVAFLIRQIECVARKAGAPAETFEKVVLDGDPARQIVKLAQEEAADLIVMGTHGYGPFRRFVLGSVTAKVLHDIDCPAFTGAHVPEIAAEDPRPYRRVACAVDLSGHSEKVLRWAMEFAGAYDAGLALIHAAPSLDVSGLAGQYGAAEWRQHLIQNAAERARTLLAKAGARAEMFIDTAAVTEFVPAAVKEFRADLMVIGRSVREGLLGRLRTNAYALIRESPCPVVSV